MAKIYSVHDVSMDAPLTKCPKSQHRRHLDPQKEKEWLKSAIGWAIDQGLTGRKTICLVTGNVTCHSGGN